jgi:hypothetical protein
MEKENTCVRTHPYMKLDPAERERTSFSYMVCACTCPASPAWSLSLIHLDRASSTDPASRWVLSERCRDGEEEEGWSPQGVFYICARKLANGSLSFFFLFFEQQAINRSWSRSSTTGVRPVQPGPVRQKSSSYSSRSRESHGRVGDGLMGRPVGGGGTSDWIASLIPETSVGPN